MPDIAPGPSPFHHGEQTFQIRVGGMHTRAATEQMGRRVVRDSMPEQHRSFFANQQLMYFAAQEPATGTVWASAMAGPRGFLSSPSPQLLEFAGGAHMFGDPAAAALKQGSHIGLLGLELHTRRRNRMNGIVLQQEQQSGAMLVHVDQSFGNCPKYIQARQLEMDPVGLQSMSTQASGLIQEGQGALGPEQQTLIRSADTFFIATSSSSGASSAADARASLASTAAENGAASNDAAVGATDYAAARQLQPPMAAATGLDVSHRGGPPGFVVLGRGGTMLQWADYPGNNMYNTFGNLALNPTCGLLFIDWASGDTLQLTGRAAVNLHDSSLPGGQRTVAFEVGSWRHARRALPIRSSAFLEASPHNPGPMASAASAPAAAGAAGDAKGCEREDQCGIVGGEWLECKGVRVEASGIKSYVFQASAAMSAAMAAGRLPYQPGQYASFDFHFPQAAIDAHKSRAAGGAAAAAMGGTSDASSSTGPANSAASAAGAADGAAASGGAAAASSGCQTVNRTWTISSHPAETAASGSFSITVKRIGLVSEHLWECMAPGKRVLFRGTGGDFTLAEGSVRPVLLIAGGIGITPLRTMFLECIQQHKPATLLYSVRRPGEAAFLQELATAADSANAAAAAKGALQAAAAATAPETAAGDDVAGSAQPYQVLLTTTGDQAAAAAAAVVASAALTAQAGAVQLEGAAMQGSHAAPKPSTSRHGRVSADLLREALPCSAQADVYLCGPLAFMEAVQHICLGELGHAHEPFTESFAY